MSSLNDVQEIGRDARRALEGELVANEVVLVVIPGQKGVSLVATDRRVGVFRDKRWTWFRPSETSVTLHGGMGSAYIAVFPKGKETARTFANAQSPNFISIGTMQLRTAQARLPVVVSVMTRAAYDPRLEFEPPGGVRSGLALPQEEVLDEAEGNGCHIWVLSGKVRIKHSGIRGLVGKGFLKGDKELWVDQISGVQWRDPGSMWLGHMQFTLIGGTTDSQLAGLDENAVQFDAEKVDAFRRIRARVEEQMRASRSHMAAPPTPDIPGQIRKLAELRDAGVLTDDEFQAKKADLLARM